MNRPLSYMILAGDERDRLTYSLWEQKPSKVVVIENSNPRPEHEEYDKYVHRLVSEILRKCEIPNEFFGVDFYNSSEPLFQLYDLFLRHKRGADVKVDICGGTKLVAMNAAMAASLAGCDTVYYGHKEYVRKDSAWVGQGSSENQISIPPLLQYLIPNFNPRKYEILDALRKGSFDTVSILCRHLYGHAPVNKIAETSYYLKQLRMEGLATGTEKSWEITKSGTTTARLVEIFLKNQG